MTRLIRLSLAVVAALLPVAHGAAQPPVASWAPPAVMTDPGPDGRRIERDGIVGNFYLAPGAGRHPGILLLGGSEGALGAGTAAIARALQSQGYAVLHLSYFRAPGQSPKLELVPLELFDRALAWLKRQPGVDRRRLAVVGGSKGAEGALLVGSRHPELKAVVAGMPSSVVWPGIDWTGTGTAPSQSSWSLAGRPVPMLPYGAGAPTGPLADIYLRGLATLPAHRDARIPVERGRFPILLVCGETDSLWPSCPMARQIAESAAGRVTILAYPDAGHGVFGPPVTGDPQRLAALGGTGAGNQAAREDGWPRVLAFLQGAFR